MFENLDTSALTGIVILPGDLGYDAARQGYNRAVQKYPLAIVSCLGACDVSNAVRWARANGVGLRVRSGGHNDEGYSTGNAVLVIDLGKMDGIRVDVRRRTVELQGGARMGQLYDRLAAIGRPFPGGACPAVGLSGFALGGGWGYSCRFLGLGCDSLLELRLIDGKGDVLTASESRNADLFWACRGGGNGSFGVVVSMTFRLPPKAERVTYFTLYRQGVSGETQAKFLDAWQSWLPGLDRRMTLRPSLYHSADEGRAIYSRGLYYGRPEDARRLLKPLVDSAGLRLRTLYTSFAEAMSIIGSAYPSSEMVKSTGRFADAQLGRDDISRIVGLLDELPEGISLVEIGLYALGGRVAQVSAGATAYYYRSARYIMGMQAVWTNPRFAETGEEWVSRAFGVIEPLTAGSYVNFPYDGLADHERAYYGENVPRLKQVKAAYDPEAVFRHPQSIEP